MLGLKAWAAFTRYAVGLWRARSLRGGSLAA